MKYCTSSLNRSVIAQDNLNFQIQKVSEMLLSDQEKKLIKDTFKFRRLRKN